MTGLALAAALLLVLCRPARRLTWRAVRGTIGGLLAIAAEVLERRRSRELTSAPHQPAARPARQPPPVPRAWRVRLSTRVDGFVVPLAEGDVVGPWRDAAEVRAEALTRLAEAGWPAGDHRVYAEAWPLPSGNERAA
jgi:hypothetical protein